MRRISHLFAIAAALIVVQNAFGQNVMMGDPGFNELNPANCNTFGVSSNNFFDDGNASNYSANFNDTTVFCPDLTLGTKMSMSFSINAGFEFDVDGSDTIYVYDGPNTTWPLIGAHNSVTDPTGFTHTASWNNPSGCLTVVFISDGAVEGTGWIANVQCGNQPQPFDMHIEAYINGTGQNALNPLDTGFVDICFGDSILFVAAPIFPYSQEMTTYGYSQDVNSNIDFDWNISDGNTYPNNDSIWFTPQTQNGFLIDLAVTDMFPQIQHMDCKVRVSIQPYFTGTGPEYDPLCLGDIGTLLGGVTPTDTVGISIAPGTFQMGGSYAGLTYLPDGSGQQYTTSIPISGFPAGAIINNAQSLNEVCITMEHSYLGDLEIWLECPNGTIVPLVNSYSPGAIPGGTSGGGTYLGQPYDDSGGGGAGIGWEYCFSSAFNTITGSMTQNLGNTVAVPSVPTNVPPLSAGNSIDNSVVYEPETSFNTFAGCPVNGNWTIHVQDNLGIDDGYIFEWGLFFDGSYFPGASPYQNYVVTDYWVNDPTIISNQNDTLILVQPPAPGAYDYTYVVTDDFGCTYDTTVTVNVLEPADIFDDTLICLPGFQVTGTQSYAGGTWISPNAGVGFGPSNTTLNPLVTMPSTGTFTVGFIDSYCEDTLYADITLVGQPVILNDTSLCDLSLQVSGTIVDGTGTWTEPSGDLTFSSSPNDPNPTITSTQSGVYTVTFTEDVCGNSDQAQIEFISPPSIFGDTIACNFGLVVSGTTSYNGGVWSSPDTAIHFNPNNTVENPEIWTYGQDGVYTVTYTDNACNMSVTAVIDFYEYPSTWLEDTTLCIGTGFALTAPNNNPHPTTYTWSNGTTGEILVTEVPGIYYLTMSNTCHNNYDTIVVDFKLCDINVPNILSLAEGSQNALWYVQAQGLSEFEVFITNRWGNVVYECTDPHAKCYWDGRNKGGEFVEEGTYFYNIKAKDENDNELMKQGFIHVVN